LVIWLVSLSQQPPHFSPLAAVIVEPANIMREIPGRKTRLGLFKCAIIPFNGDLK
jgi:hypothetical protein